MHKGGFRETEQEREAHMGRDEGSQKHSGLRLGRLERQGRRGAELHLEITAGHVASSSHQGGGGVGGGFLTELQEHSGHSRAMFTASSSKASPRQKQRLRHCSFTLHSFNKPGARCQQQQPCPQTLDAGSLLSSDPSLL